MTIFRCNEYKQSCGQYSLHDELFNLKVSSYTEFKMKIHFNASRSYISSDDCLVV